MRRVPAYNGSGIAQPVSGMLQAMLSWMRDLATELDFTNAVTVVTAADSPYTAGTAETYHVDASAGPVTIQLPVAEDSPRRRVSVTKIDATFNIVTIIPSGADTINNAANIKLLVPFQSYNFYPTVGDWYII